MSFVRWVFRLGAISNFLVTIQALFDPVGAWSLLDRLEPLLPASWQTPLRPLAFPSFLMLWSGMAFLWGILMWEVSLDPLGKAALIKYAYVEKLVTLYAIVWGCFAHGGLSLWLFFLVLYTDALWIPLYIVAHRKVRAQAAKLRASATTA